jgi:2-C-methyl-D-erythritol 4-phosphate cytidylyltransferase/2-C-methyl-D-erythritol 2,4-cyclodiphosphate synthase
MTTVAVIVSAGRGTRVGGDGPKQYRVVAGRPLICETLDRVLSHPAIDSTLCVIHPDDRDLYDGAIGQLSVDPGAKLLAPVAGGRTRQISVRNALSCLARLNIEAGDLCLVHDAARPFVSADLIATAIEAGFRGAAVPVVPVTDTIKRVDTDGAVVETLDRSMLRTVQTPQAFLFGLLRDAHEAAAEAGLDAFSDDGSLAEWAGKTVQSFPGDPANMKITHPADIEQAESRLRSRQEALPVTRVGTGFDVHVFGEGDHVWLGGLRISHHRGVVAHSDGDVVLHALTDAVLGALADGDIGSHFPPSDPAWRGASSDRFLAFAVDRVRALGGTVDHLDATVLCETPKIGPHREAMRERIADIAGVTISSVAIKATTTERLGFTGRGEGIAAQAAATIRVPVPR